MGAIYFLSSILSEQIGVSTCIGHKKYQFTVVLISGEQPVGGDVTFPITLILAMQYVWMILLWQTAFSGEDMEHISQQLLVISPL